MQRVSTVLLWAKGNGHRGDSLTDEIRAARKALPRQSDQQRHHKALPCTDVAGFIQKLRDFSTSEPIKLGFEFLVLTASRTNVVLYAKWSEINLEDKVCTIPESRTKANKQHRVPLSIRCIATLRAAQALGDARRKAMCFREQFRANPYPTWPSLWCCAGWVLL